MTVGTATVPAVINADGTWTIDNNGTATTHVFDLDSTLFNFVDGTGNEMLALTFDEDTDEAAFRFMMPNGTNFILSWDKTSFTGSGFTLTPPQGFAFFGTYDQAVALNFSIGQVDTSTKALQWSGAVQDQWDYEGTLMSNSSAIESGAVHRL